MVNGEIRDEVQYQTAVSRMGEIDSRLDELNAVMQTGSASDEQKEELQHLQDEKTGLNQRIGLFLQNQGRPMQQSLPSAPGSWQPPPAPASTTSPTPPKQERRRMSRLMTVLVVVGLVLAALGGYWFATEGYTIQSPISDFNIEFQSPIVAPDSSDNASGSGTETTEPDFGATYSPPPGSGFVFVCDKDTYLGKTPDGDPMYSKECPDPPVS